MVDFKKFSDPEWIEEWEREKKEREKLYEEKEKLRKQTVCFTGHRPDKLGGYDENNPVMVRMRQKLFEVIETLINQEGKTRFISGGALGTDQEAFWVVEALKKEYPNIVNIVATPFKNQDSVWSDTLKYRYQHMLEKADEVVNVEELDEYKVKGQTLGEFSKEKMKKRNEYMVDHSEAIVAVFDGSHKSGTANCIAYARNRYLGHQLWRLYPQVDFDLDITYLA
ncbi:SLOG family protein [Bacillus subtilis]|uniref:SLOG family protein n=1 Tax=Bacillus subtilis TaxID=1423 RepID=UPI001CFA1FD3|nr:SLOG family protein [Bacillus subtilis]MCB4338852.1 hypothetical protein [Bacillus subtilis]